MMARREGFGAVLADGWFRLKNDFGLDPQDYRYSGFCKGMDFIYDARPSNLHPLMMSFFTRPRPHHGGSHTRTNSRNKTVEEIREQVEAWGLADETLERIFRETPYSGKFNVGRYTKHMEDMMRVKNSLGLCSIFSYQGLILGTDLAKLYNAATGEDLTPGEMIRRGERVSNLAKLVNVREGFTRKDDRVPEIWFKPMQSPEGTIETRDYFNTKPLEKEDAERMLDDYYDERGWDIDKGTPTRGTLQELELEQYAN